MTDRKILRKVASERERIHKNHPSNRPLSRDYEFISLVGEDVLADEFSEFGFTIDLTLRPSGDGGTDFSSSLGKIDAKTYRNAIHVLVEQNKVNSDVYVLAQYHEDTETATLLGWEYKDAVLQTPLRNFGYGVLNHHIHRRDLRSIQSLKEKLREKMVRANPMAEIPEPPKDEFVSLFDF